MNRSVTALREEMWYIYGRVDGIFWIYEFNVSKHNSSKRCIVVAVSLPGWWNVVVMTPRN